MIKLLVLPFDMDPGVASAGFSKEMIQEELIEILLENPEIQPASKTTSRYLSNHPLSAQLLKEEYNLDYILEGGINVQSYGLIIRSRLISTEDDSILFSNSYPFDSSNWPIVVAQISEEITNKLTDQYRSMNGSQIPTRAEQEYQTGLYHWTRYTFDEIKLAIRYFKNALRYDAEHVSALSALADCYCVIGVMGFDNPQSAFLEAKQYAKRAFKLNNKRSEIFVSAALVDIFMDRDYDQARVNLEQALLLNKHNLKAHHVFAMYFIHKNDLAAAEKHALFNIRRAPKDIPYYDMMARICLYKKEFLRGLGYVLKALKLDPGSIELIELQGQMHMHLGNFEQAIECFQICRYKNPDNPLYHSNLAYIFSKCNYHLDQKKVMDEMYSLQSGIINASNFNYAKSIVSLGILDYNSFFKQINLAIDDGLGLFVGDFIGNPIYNEIRKDRRFTLLLDRLNLGQTRIQNTKKRLPASIFTISTLTKEVLTLDPQNIAYVESQANYSKVYWFDQGILRNLLLRVPISNLERQLHSFDYIHRCHKSYLINMNESLTISGNARGLFLESDFFPIRIPISRSKSAIFSEMVYSN